MKSELIVDVQPREVSIALLEDNRLVSIQKESRNLAYAVGDIYLARVKKIMPGLNAAFVNVGYEKDAFLHYLDLGARFTSNADFLQQVLKSKKGPLPQLQKFKLQPEIDKHGTITDQLTCGQTLLVQIVKEPISTKGPRITTELTFTGRYMVLVPFGDKISVSQKIKTTGEKLRLRHLVESIKPKNFGVIIRTSAEGKNVSELVHEMETLLRCWEDTLSKARGVSEPPALVFEEESRIVGELRDVFSPSFEAIHVNDADTAAQITKYVSLIAPGKESIVSTYQKPEPIFDHFGVTRQIKSSLGKTVSFKSGAYIIIEHTEALHVIDVNSGNRSKADDQESTALEVNINAADEIARQLRLRDMGGIIVVDFIDMAKAEHRQALYDHMREVMAQDRARHNILPLSKFGLMQITRQRVRPVMDITVTESCPSCFGKGEVQPSLLFTDTLREKISYLLRELKVKQFTMYVHPYVDAYLKKGIISLAMRWRHEFGGRFKIIPDQSLAYLQYRVVDAQGTEIDLRQEKDLEKTSATKAKQKAKTRVEQD